MYEAKATIKDLSRTLSGEWVLSLAVSGDIVHAFEALKNKALRFALKEWREKRSLDANAYCWVLLSKMADVLRTDKDSIYLEMLKRYGQGGIVKVRDKDAAAILREIKYHEEHEQLQAEKAKYYRIWVGSSNYDTQEMAVFIDGIVSECRGLGIETATPQELERYKEAWGR